MRLSSLKSLNTAIIICQEKDLRANSQFTYQFFYEGVGIRDLGKGGDLGS